LSLLESQSLGGTNTIMLRFHIDNGQPVREVMQRMAAIQIFAILQPNYIYLLAEDAAPASRGDIGAGDDAQYILKKLNISDVHRIVRGTNVPIAVIDSEIDAAHPDLQGVIAQRFSAAETRSLAISAFVATTGPICVNRYPALPKQYPRSWSPLPTLKASSGAPSRIQRRSGMRSAPNTLWSNNATLSRSSCSSGVAVGETRYCVFREAVHILLSLYSSSKPSLT